MQFSTALRDLFDLDYHKNEMEKRLSEAKDKATECEVLLKRKDRDLVEAEGRLKYNPPQHEQDLAELKVRVAALGNEVSLLKGRQLKQLKSDVTDAEMCVQELRALAEEALGKFRGELGPAVAAGSAEDAPHPSALVVTSFREVVGKIVAELAGAVPSKRLVVFDGGAEDVPHYSSWEQRALATLLSAKEQIARGQSNIVSLANACGAAFPSLSSDKEKWALFIASVDYAMEQLVLRTIVRVLEGYERVLAGHGAKELFSVNMKLGGNCRIVFAPSPTDIPSLLMKVMEKVFSLCPANTVGDVISIPTGGKSGKDKCETVCRNDAVVARLLALIKETVHHFPSDISDLSTAIESEFEYLWQPDMTAMASSALREAVMTVEVNFPSSHSIRGGIVVNAFPMQDALLSMCSTQLAKAEDQEFAAAISTESVKKAMKDSTLAGARTAVVAPPVESPTKKVFSPQRVVDATLQAVLAALAQAAPPPEPAKKERLDLSKVQPAPTEAPPSNSGPDSGRKKPKRHQEGAAAAEALGVNNLTPRESPRPSTTPIGSRVLKPLDQQSSLTPQKLPRGSSQPSSESQQKEPPPRTLESFKTSSVRSSAKAWEEPAPASPQQEERKPKPAAAAAASSSSKKDDSDESSIQRLLQKERESLERIKRMKEENDRKRREQREQRQKEEREREKTAEKEKEEEQQRMAKEREEAELRERARRRREAEEAERVRQLQEEDAERRRQDREKRAALEALRQQQREQQKLQEDLERRLEEEMKRRAAQQQREKEERQRVREGQELAELRARDQQRKEERGRQEASRRHTEEIDRKKLDEARLQVEEHQRMRQNESSALRKKLSPPPVGRPPVSSEELPPSARAEEVRKQPSPPLLPPPEKKPSTAPSGTPRQRPTPRLSPVPSLFDEYKAFCTEFGIKPNSGLLKTLPKVPGENVFSINLDLNYIGVKGVQPLLQILKRNRGLTLLNLKDNNLENNEVRALVSVLLGPSGDDLVHLDLSNNPISLAGGSALMELVSKKPSLTTVVLKGTLIQPKVVDKIVEAAETNKRAL